MYARGLSTRDIEAAFRNRDTGKLLLSRTAVSEVTERLWAEYEAFATRDLSEFPVVYFFVDGIAERLHASERRQGARGTAPEAWRRSIAADPAIGGRVGRTSGHSGPISGSMTTPGLCARANGEERCTNGIRRDPAISWVCSIHAPSRFRGSIGRTSGLLVRSIRGTSGIVVRE
jgi:hypothetical protein